ncbi:DUF2512 family protein [Brevibacillus borstelensis]|uniref:DUF2512 family protein n=1 Tax=Brevibacillus borstelensis TaxID=45462 RepID=UPI0030C06841
MALYRFLLKLVINGIIVVPFVYWFTEASVWASIVTSVGLSIIAYLIGDQLILRASNNLVATFSDAILAAVYLWAVAAFMRWNFSFGEILFTVLVLGVAEFFYHRILGRVDQQERQGT